MLKIIKESYLTESVDSNNNQLTREQANYFRNSKIRDKNDNLLVCYHGSGHKNITTFDMYDSEYKRPKCFFSAVEKYSNEYAYDPDTDEPGKTYQVYLNITNPFDIKDPKCQELAKQILGELPTTRKIVDTAKLFNELYKNKHKYGYDGIIAGEELPPKDLKQFGNDANISYVPFYSNQIKLVSNKTPTSSNRVDESKNKFKSQIKESKDDFDKFSAWCYNDPENRSLYTRFVDIKDRLKGYEKDIYYWMKDNKYDELDELLTNLENTPTRKEKEDKARKGAELLYKDNEWEVCHISTYNASVKYGKNTSWCITGSNSGGLSGKEYWDNYIEGGDKIYFYINKRKNNKWALVIHKDNNWTLYDSSDWIDVDTTYDYEDELDCWNPYDASQPNFPIVKGLPNINQEYERCKQEIGYYEEE